MGPFPSNKAIFVTLLVLLTWYGYSFLNNAKQQFFQLNFDWAKSEKLSEPVQIKIDSLSYDFLRFTTKEIITPNPQFTYQFKTIDDIYYFRYVFSQRSENEIVLTGIEWITGIPEPKIKIADITPFFVPMKQRSDISVLTFGSDFLVANEAKYFRKELAKMRSVNFLGRNRDVYNYANEAYLHFSTDQLLGKLQGLPLADTYVIALGNDTETPSNKTKASIDSIVSTLEKRSGSSKIIFLTLPILENTESSTHISEINSILENLNYPNIVVINTDLLFSKNPSKYILENGIGINKEGYQLLAKKVSEYIEQ